jgi:hypothetical protein
MMFHMIRDGVGGGRLNGVLDQNIERLFKSLNLTSQILYDGL